MNRFLLTLIIVAAALGTSRLALAVDTDQDHKTTAPSDKDEDMSSKDNEKQDQKLAKEFNVNENLIDNLRKQKLGYGEIRHVLTIANQMPGGINDENTKKIMDMRQGGEHKEGWGRIAQDLGVKLNTKNEENERVEIPKNKNAGTHENAHAEKHGVSNESAAGAGMSQSQHMNSGMGGGMGHGHEGK